MKLLLRLYADRLFPNTEARAPEGNRVIYVREGDAVVRSAGQAAGMAADSAWHGRAAISVTAGAAGASLLRWELVPEGTGSGDLAGGAAVSTPALSQAVDLGDPAGYVMRCDRVDFPPGGIAYAHVHRGPGIRCLLAGTIRVEVNGASQDVTPGGAWFEAGPDPVLATASRLGPTAFARVMILPREVRGKSSIRYVDPDDADKPRTQTYRIFVDEPIELR